MPTKKTSKTASKTTLKLELAGQISLVEFQGKKRVAVHPLNSKFALALLKAALVNEDKQ